MKKSKLLILIAMTVSASAIATRDLGATSLCSHWISPDIFDLYIDMHPESREFKNLNSDAIAYNRAAESAIEMAMAARNLGYTQVGTAVPRISHSLSNLTVFAACVSFKEDEPLFDNTSAGLKYQFDILLKQLKTVIKKIAGYPDSNNAELIEHVKKSVQELAN
ncbi:hypothetical protein ACFL6Y_09915 [Elusimicrobiota bacterium]